MNLERDELIARLTLLATPGLSAPRVLDLLEAYGSGRFVIDRLGEECGPDIEAAARSAIVRDRVDHALRVIDELRVHAIAHDDPVYPVMMRMRLERHAPVMLFARGRLDLLERRGIAVVGTREASEYGLDMADRIGGGIARAGGAVVSGVARGIDAAAHTAALDSNGATIGILGCGIDISYPRSNASLQERIATEGLLLCEFLPGEPPLPPHFPHRNRLIVALSEAVVVVEAGERSGTMTTGGHAANQGVPVYCVPNVFHHPNMQGILRLQRDGAGAYTGLRDLLESTGIVQLGDDSVDMFEETAPAGRVHARVWSAIGVEPVHADVIAREAGVSPTAALVALLELELDGRVRQLDGQRFQRIRRERRNAALARG